MPRLRKPRSQILLMYGALDGGPKCRVRCYNFLYRPPRIFFMFICHTLLSKNKGREKHVLLIISFSSYVIIGSLMQVNIQK